MAEAINASNNEPLDEVEKARKVKNFIEEKLRITQEDLDQILTQEELTKLCLKRKCVVEIYRWNPCVDWIKSFKESGRWYRWNAEVRLGMQAKIINRKREASLYTDAEIAKIRRTEWKERKKDNLLDLNYWKHVEEREKKKQQAIMDDGDNISLQFTESSDEEDSQTVIDAYQSHSGIESHPNIVTPADEQIMQNTKSLEFSEKNSDKEDSQIVIDANQSHASIESHPNIVTPGNDAVKNIFFAVNTESMSIDDSQYSTQSQTTNMLEKYFQPSQDLIAPDYDDFNTQMPVTSTQSQNAELKDMVD